MQQQDSNLMLIFNVIRKFVCDTEFLKGPCLNCVNVLALKLGALDLFRDEAIVIIKLYQLET